MTVAQQKRFYFPAWNGCARERGWLMVKGRLWADLYKQREESLDWPALHRGLLLQVLQGAEHFAGTHHREVIPDDLRYACNVVAGGRLHSKDLSNRQVSRVVNLFRLLADPWDLEAVMEWLNPEETDRKSFVGYLRSCGHEAAIMAIARNAFQEEDWEKLPMERLRWICGRLKKRNQPRRELQEDPF